MPERASQAVEPPHDHGVAGAELVEHRVQRRPLCELPGRLVDEDSLATRRAEGVLLEGFVLVQGRHPRVADLVAVLGTHAWLSSRDFDSGRGLWTREQPRVVTRRGCRRTAHY